MRSNKELLKIFLNHKKYFLHGLCNWLEALYTNSKINHEEYYYLKDIISSKRPRRSEKRSFIDKIFNLDNQNSLLSVEHGYYWDMDEIKPRIKWLKKHLK